MASASWWLLPKDVVCVFWEVLPCQGPAARRKAKLQLLFFRSGDRPGLCARGLGRSYCAQQTGDSQAQGMGRGRVRKWPGKAALGTHCSWAGDREPCGLGKRHQPPRHLSTGLDSLFHASQPSN